MQRSVQCPNCESHNVLPTYAPARIGNQDDVPCCEYRCQDCGHYFDSETPELAEPASGWSLTDWLYGHDIILLDVSPPCAMFHACSDRDVTCDVIQERGIWSGLLSRLFTTIVNVVVVDNTDVL